MHFGRVGVWSRELRRYADPGKVADAAAELEGLGYLAIFIPGGATAAAITTSADATRSMF